MADELPFEHPAGQPLPFEEETSPNKATGSIQAAPGGVEGFLHGAKEDIVHGGDRTLVGRGLQAIGYPKTGLTDQGVRDVGALVEGGSALAGGEALAANPLRAAGGLLGSMIGTAGGAGGARLLGAGNSTTELAGGAGGLVGGGLGVAYPEAAIETSKGFPLIGRMIRYATRPGPIERAAMPPGARPGLEYAGEDYGPHDLARVGEPRSRTGGVLIRPEPTRAPLVGGEKTAFSLPLEKLEAAAKTGTKDVAAVESARSGKPLILTPKEGTGYPGPRTEAAPIIERRGAGRSALTTPTEIEKRLATAPSTVRNVFDDTEGSNATIAKDVDRLAGPKPGAGTKTEYSYKAGEGQPHEVVSKDASGKVTGKTMASGSGNELTVHFDGTNASSQGQGHALARLEGMAKQTGAKVLKSDISTTAGERAVWDKLQSRYPANVTKKTFADGQVQYTWNLKGGK